LSVQDQALVIASIAKLFPEQVAREFATWVGRKQTNPYEEAMELDPVWCSMLPWACSPPRSSSTT
jgi:hypothetical protein